MSFCLSCMTFPDHCRRQPGVPLFYFDLLTLWLRLLFVDLVKVRQRRRGVHDHRFRVVCSSLPICSGCPGAFLLTRLLTLLFFPRPRLWSGVFVMSLNICGHLFWYVFLLRDCIECRQRCDVHIGNKVFRHHWPTVWIVYQVRRLVIFWLAHDVFKVVVPWECEVIIDSWGMSVSWVPRFAFWRNIRLEAINRSDDVGFSAPHWVWFDFVSHFVDLSCYGPWPGVWSEEGLPLARSYDRCQEPDLVTWFEGTLLIVVVVPPRSFDCR